MASRHACIERAPVQTTRPLPKIRHVVRGRFSRIVIAANFFRLYSQDGNFRTTSGKCIEVPRLAVATILLTVNCGIFRSCSFSDGLVVPYIDVTTWHMRTIPTDVITAGSSTKLIRSCEKTIAYARSVARYRSRIVRESCRPRRLHNRERSRLLRNTNSLERN